MEVRYPDGSLVDDQPVCVSGILATPGVEIFGVSFGATGVIDGAVSEREVFAGLPYTVAAGVCGAPENPIAPVFHNGRGLQRGEVQPTDALLNPVIVATGERRTITLTTGRSVLKGRFTSADSGGCWATAIGTPTGSGLPSSPQGIFDIDGQNYEILVPPGRYIVKAMCPFSEPVFWGGATEETASAITVTHGQIADGLNLAPTRLTDSGEPDDRSVGVVSATLQTAEDQLTPHCTELYTVGSATPIRRTYTAAAREWTGAAVPLGSYEMRIVDCYGAGFDPVWVPGYADRAGASTIEVSLAHPFDIFIDMTAPLRDPQQVYLCGGRVATIVGTEGDDTLLGTPDDDVIVGLGGDDVIRGFDGEDFICGGNGRDLLVGGQRKDRLWGGPGRDVLRGGQGKDRLYGERNRDRLIGGGGNDFLVGGHGPGDRLVGRLGIDRCIDPEPDTSRSTCESEI